MKKDILFHRYVEPKDVQVGDEYYWRGRWGVILSLESENKHGFIEILLDVSRTIVFAGRDELIPVRRPVYWADVSEELPEKEGLYICKRYGYHRPEFIYFRESNWELKLTVTHWLKGVEL